MSETELMLLGIEEGLKMFGCEINKVTKDTVYLSIPRHPKSESGTTPEQIADCTQKTLNRLTKNTVTVKYKIID